MREGFVMAKGSKRGAGQAAGDEMPGGHEAKPAGMPDAGIRAQPIRPAQKIAAGSRDLPGQAGRPVR